MSHEVRRSEVVPHGAAPLLPVRQPGQDAHPQRLGKGPGLAGRGLHRLQSIGLERLPRIGRGGGAGLVLLIASAVFWFSTAQPLARHATELEREVARLDAELSAGTTVAHSPAAQIDALLASLPTPAELPAIVAAVTAQADEAGLELESGRYELTTTRSGELARYRLAFPVRGSYPQVRQFIDGTLIAVPSLALDGLHLERRAIGDEVIDADLRFAVIVRSGP